MNDRYENLRQLLANETYPHRYTHKFIGLNTPAFLAAVAEFDRAFPKAQEVARRPSGAGESAEARYLAFTFEIEAESVEEIITLIEATGSLQDLKMIL